METYGSLVKSLKRRRDVLNKAIELLDGSPESDEKGPTAVSTRKPRAARESSSASVPLERGAMKEAVLRAVKEHPRTSTEATDRVCSFSPHTSRINVQQAIYRMQKDGLLHKDENLKLHVVENGRIV